MNIRNKHITYPIIQGGMGVGISLGNLAGNVANCGGIGIISTANVGFQEDDFYTNSLLANSRALQKEILNAVDISNQQGLIGINAMVATVQYEELIKVAVESGVDCIISGAGLPLKLPEYTQGSDVLLAPIVSSARATSAICRYWDKKYHKIPDFLVIEGSRAGGHLGFHGDDISNYTAPELSTILQEVKEVLHTYEVKYEYTIPIFVAGSINTPNEIQHMLSLGADGVQIATRFIATTECDASLEFKEQYIKANNEDIIIVISPVGMPARALNTPFLKRLQESGRIAPTFCINCIHTCNVNETPYCITNALIQAQQGNYEDGLFFCDDNVEIITELTTVSRLMKEFTSVWRENKCL